MKALLSLFLLFSVFVLGYFTFVYQSEPLSLIVKVLDNTTGEKNHDNASFTVRLNQSPGWSGEVIIVMKSSDETQGILDQKELKFSSDNWNVAQTVTVVGQDEYIDDGDVKYQIIVQAFDRQKKLLDSQSVELTALNDDVRDFLIGVIPSEKEQPWVDLRIKPNSEPSQPVTVHLKAGTSNNNYEGQLRVPKGKFKAHFDKNVLHFDSKNWKIWQKVRVTSSTGSLNENSVEEIQKNFDDLGIDEQTQKPIGLFYVLAIVSSKEKVREYRGSSNFVVIGKRQCQNCNIPMDAK